MKFPSAGDGGRRENLFKIGSTIKLMLIMISLVDAWKGMSDFGNFNGDIFMNPLYNSHNRMQG